MKLSQQFKIVRGGVLAVAMAAGTAAPAMADFNYPDFSSTAGLTLNGAAVQTANTISVTPPVRASAGSFWRTDRQSVVNGFTTTFTFRMRDVAGLGADGFAFLVHNSAQGASALGGTGGALGYATNEVFSHLPGQQGIENSLAVEFDGWDNQTPGDWTDFSSDRHVSVQTNGTGDNRPSAGFSRGHAILGADLADGAVHTVHIAYSPGTMNIFLNDLVTPLLTVNVDLGTLLNLSGGEAYVGFTAGTGALANVQRHEVLSWEFGSTIVPSPAAATLLATGGGLLIGRRRRR